MIKIEKNLNASRRASIRRKGKGKARLVEVCVFVGNKCGRAGEARRAALQLQRRSAAAARHAHAASPAPVIAACSSFAALYGEPCINLSTVPLYASWRLISAASPPPTPPPPGSRLRAGSEKAAALALQFMDVISLFKPPADSRTPGRGRYSAAYDGPDMFAGR